MAREGCLLLLKLAFDGTDLAGSAYAAGQRTVAGEVAAALARLGEREAVVDPLCRTDAGVHARELVVLVQGIVRPQRVLRGLRRHLPPDVALRAVAEVAAPPVTLGRHYRYVLDVSAAGQPRLARFCWRPPFEVDLVALAPLGAQVAGRRDWSAFARRGEQRDDRVRRIDRVAWSGAGGLVWCDVEGEGFTYRLVRSLVGAMLAVARGVATDGDLEAALAGAAGDVAREQAPARGLHLCAIRLDPPPAWVGEEDVVALPFDP